MPETKIVEVTNYVEGGEVSGCNYGKFMLMRWTEIDWNYPSQLPGNGGRPLMSSLGHDRRGIWVLDLQTREGAMFYPFGNARYDLNKHKVWVCPLFEPFLEWLYRLKHDGVDPWDACTPLVQLPGDTPSAMYGYRRPGETT